MPGVFELQEQQHIIDMIVTWRAERAFYPFPRVLLILFLNCRHSSMSAGQEMWQWTAGAFPDVHELAMLLTQRIWGSRQLSGVAGGRTSGRKQRSCLRLVLELRAAGSGVLPDVRRTLGFELA